MCANRRLQKMKKRIANWERLVTRQLFSMRTLAQQRTFLEQSTPDGKIIGDRSFYGDIDKQVLQHTFMLFPDEDKQHTLIELLKTLQFLSFSAHMNADHLRIETNPLLKQHYFTDLITKTSIIAEVTMKTFVFMDTGQFLTRQGTEKAFKEYVSKMPAQALAERKQILIPLFDIIYRHNETLRTDNVHISATGTVPGTVIDMRYATPISTNWDSFKDPNTQGFSQLMSSGLSNFSKLLETANNALNTTIANEKNIDYQTESWASKLEEYTKRSIHLFDRIDAITVELKADYLAEKSTQQKKKQFNKLTKYVREKLTPLVKEIDQNKWVAWINQWVYETNHTAYDQLVNALNKLKEDHADIHLETHLKNIKTLTPFTQFHALINTLTNDKKADIRKRLIISRLLKEGYTF